MAQYQKHPTLAELILGKTLRTANGEYVFSTAEVLRKQVMFVPPSGKVLILNVENITLGTGPGGFPTVSLTAKVSGYTTTAGGEAQISYSEDLEVAPMPPKRKGRLIEEV